MVTKGSLELIKKINQENVLETIRSEQPISRADIARKLNLSRSTVSSIVEELIAKKFVFEVGRGNSTAEGGRRGIELGFNPRNGFGVGIDIGGTKILIDISDLDGNIIYREKRKTTNDAEAIAFMIRNSLQSASVAEGDVIAIGFGVPGITDSVRGVIVEAPALQWTNYRFREEMQRRFGIPVFVNNDVNCAALGERWLGAARHTDDLVFIAIGTGVGSAIVANGSLVQGHSFMAGEIAYFVTEEDMARQRHNQFGDFGLFESKISGGSLSESGYSAEIVFSEYEKGNARVIPIIERYIATLSMGIANIVSLLNPEKVIIGGGVSQSMQNVLPLIRETVGRLTPVKTTIDLSGLGENSAAIGAIAFAFEQVRGLKP